MIKFSEKLIAINYRNGGDFNGNFNLEDLFTLSVYSPLLGIIVDWTCNPDVSFKVFNCNFEKILYKYYFIENNFTLYLKTN